MTTVTTDLSRSAASARTARELVKTHTGMLGSRSCADAVLMVSELVSNALLHGTGVIRLRIEVQVDAVRVEVSDQGNVSLAPSPTPGAHGGWGLRIVDALADEWGVLEGSTKVWFRVTPGPQQS